MRKNLALISEEEKSVCVMLFSLLATYKTLGKITRYNIDKHELEHKTLITKKRLDEHWLFLAEKYQFPFYADASMKVDIENNYIYVDLDSY